MQLAACYKLLGLDPDADEATAKRAYKAQVRRWHPDQFAEGSITKAGAEEQLKQINVAYARIKTHLAGRQTPGAAPSPSPSRPAPAATTHRGEPATTADRRSWFDHLVNALHAFTAKRADGAPSPSATAGCRRRSGRFDKILTEMTGGPITGPPHRRPCVRDIAARRAAAGYRRRSRRGVDAVGGADHSGPVKPVGRIRGIGRRR